MLNFCDEGYNNDPFKELHVPALLDVLGIPYTGAHPGDAGVLLRQGPRACRGAGPRRARPARDLRAAGRPGRDAAVGVPGAAETQLWRQLAGHHQGRGRQQREEPARLPGAAASRVPAPADPRAGIPDRPEYTVGLIGNPDQGLRALALLEVDYSRLDPNLPRILGYESKWEPDSPYWTQIRYHEANLPDHVQGQLIEHSARLFERLGCRDYARFDFRADAKGEIKLLEVNPNPGWCWDGKLNIMAGFQGMRYTELLSQILAAAEERAGIVAKPQILPPCTAATNCANASGTVRLMRCAFAATCR